MGYTSFAYLGLLAASFFFYMILPPKHRWKVLLLFSYAFYFLNSGKYIVFILLSTVSIYLTGLMLNKIDDGFAVAKKGIPKESKKEYKAVIAWQKKFVCALAVLFNLGILVFLKYFNFLGGSVNGLLKLLHLSPSVPVLNLMLPLGISFYTMSAISYVVDVYRGKYRATDQLGKVALFLVFFPHIVEGPIGRFDLLADQLYEGHKFNYNNMMLGLQLIFWGLFKKFVLADRANMLVTTVFKNYMEYDGIYVVVAMLLYTLLLYAEFSGCMDIVMGSAQMFGITMSKNFERPFISKTVSEFWRRWHMTLGSWFRDYVFYSVSLSKTFMKFSKKVKEKLSPFLGSMVPAAIAMFAVWFSTGIWHGASWKYVAYGLYYYVIMLIGMLIEPATVKVCEKIHLNRKSVGYKLFQLVRTFILVNIGMLMFRADTFSSFIHMLGSMFTGFSFAPVADGSIFEIGCDIKDFAVLIIGALILLVVGLYEEKGHSVRETVARQNIVVRWICYYALIFIVLIFGAYGRGYQAAGFIYAQF